jgi:HEAT repeat protein
MIQLGEDAAYVLIDTFIRMLPNVSADEQAILRMELQACGPRVIPLLVALLDVPPREHTARIRQQCMIALGSFSDHEPARDALRRYAKSDAALTRKWVAEGLRLAHLHKHVESPRAILEPMLRDDPSWEVRAAAAKALGDIGCPSSVPALVDVLQHCTLTEPADRVSLLKFVVGALYALPSPAAIEPLIRVLEENPNPDLCRNTIKALSAITGKYFPSAREWRDWYARRSAAPRPDRERTR